MKFLPDELNRAWLPWLILAVTGAAFLLSIGISYWVGLHGSRLLPPAVVNLEVAISGAVFGALAVYFWLSGRSTRRPD